MEKVELLAELKRKLPSNIKIKYDKELVKVRWSKDGKPCGVKISITDKMWARLCPEIINAITRNILRAMTM